ncbi:MAG: hypothetical protein ABI374_10685 [Ginsengibacter sp.]
MSQSLNISDIQLFNLLKVKFGEKEAEQFVSLIKDKVEETFENKKDSLATKHDIARLEIKISQLEVSIAKTESKLILWAFVFWATQLGAIFAFIKILIK